MVSTTAGGRPLKSAASPPGATHGGSTDLDAGAIWCWAPERGGPSSKECAREVLSQGKWVREIRSGWAKAAQTAGPAPRPPWAPFTRNGLKLGSRHQEPPHSDVSKNLATVVVRGVLPGLRRRRTGLLPSGPKSYFKMRASVVFLWKPRS